MRAVLIVVLVAGCQEQPPAWIAPVDGEHVGAAMLERQHEVDAVALPGGGTAIAWTDDMSAAGVSGWTCAFAADDGGWTTTLRYRHAGYQLSGNPAVAVARDGTLYALCMSVDEGYGKGALDLARSDDRGRSWTPWSTVASRVGGIPDRPKLLACGGALHLVFTDVVLRDGLPLLSAAIVYQRSTDGGRTWSPPRELSGIRDPDDVSFIDGYQGGAIECAADGTIVIAWGDYYGRTVHTTTSATAGETFSAPTDVPLGDVLIGTPCLELAVASTSRDMVMTVHEGHAVGDTHWSRSGDAGASWQPVAEPLAVGTNIALAFDGEDRLHATWLEATPTTFDTRYARSRDLGASFGPSVSLSSGPYPIASDDPLVTENLGSYHAMVIDDDGRPSLFGLDFRRGIAQPALFRYVWQPAP